MHKAEELVESFSRCTRNGFVAANLKGAITYFSPIMEELTGWHESEMLGKPVGELCAIPKSATINKEGDMESLAGILYTREGKKITMPLRRTDIFNDSGEKNGEMILFVTSQYMNDVGRVQSEFVSTVSHELRTPITSIKGFAATLLQHKDNIDKDKRDKYIRVIKDQAERLQRLIEDLLAVSRLESKKLQLTIQPLEVKPIIEDVAIIVENKYNLSHQILIKANNVDLPQTWADPDRVEQILTNLIDNAVKYSPGADKVEVSLDVSEKDAKRLLRIDVRDYGIGISEEDAAKIFDKFSRLDSPLTRTTEGTGLGLFISKSLAQLLGGDLEVKPATEGEGTVFSLYLPTESADTKPCWD